MAVVQVVEGARWTPKILHDPQVAHTLPAGIMVFCVLV